MQITFHGLSTDQPIKAIKFIRSLISIEQPYDDGARIGLKDAKDVMDGLRAGTIRFTFEVERGYETFVEDAARAHGFILTPPPEVREVTLASIVTLPEPPQDNEWMEGFVPSPPEYDEIPF